MSRGGESLTNEDYTMPARRRAPRTVRPRRTGSRRTPALLLLLFLLGASVAASLAPKDQPKPDAPTTGEFAVNTYTPDDQTYPKVARGPDGTSVVAWISFEEEAAGTSWDVYARPFLASGAPIGGELHVNLVPGGDQGGLGALDVAICQVPAIPMVNSTFIVVWGDESAAPLYNVMAQVFNVSTAPPTVEPVGPNFLVNTYVPGDQGSGMELVSISMGSRCKDGVIAWGELLSTSDTPPHDDTSGDIFAREFAMFPPFFTFAWVDTVEWRVNTNTTSNQHDPEVAMSDFGEYVVCWNSWDTANPWDIMARRFTWSAADGPTAIDALDYNVSDTSAVVSDYSPSCTMLNDRTTAYVWTYDTGFDLDAYSQGLMPDRSAPYPPYPVTMYTAGDQYEPSISSNRSDTFVWTWTDGGRDGSLAGVYGWMSTMSALLGDEFLVPVNTTGNQFLSDVAMNPTGAYTITWATEASPLNVSARLYDNVPNVPESGGAALAAVAAMPAVVLLMPGLARRLRLGAERRARPAAQ